jgi:hypothetical protein
MRRSSLLSEEIKILLEGFKLGSLGVSRTPKVSPSFASQPDAQSSQPLPSNQPETSPALPPPVTSGKPKKDDFGIRAFKDIGNGVSWVQGYTLEREARCFLEKSRGEIFLSIRLFFKESKNPHASVRFLYKNKIKADRLSFETLRQHAKKNGLDGKILPKVNTTAGSFYVEPHQDWKKYV